MSLPLPERKPYQYFFVPFLMVALLWVVKFVEIYSGSEFADWGILPRTLVGLRGIIASPLIHANFAHLMSNSAPLLVLGWMLVYFYPQSARKAFIGIYLLTGFSVWLFARSHFHIGASGVIYGLAMYLFVSSVLRKDQGSSALAFFIIVMYGSMIWGILPLEEGVSWESHLSGAIVGSVLAFVFRSLDRKEPEVIELEEGEEPYADQVNYKYVYRPKEPEMPTEQ